MDTSCGTADGSTRPRGDVQPLLTVALIDTVLYKYYIALYQSEGVNMDTSSIVGAAQGLSRPLRRVIAAASLLGLPALFAWLSLGQTPIPGAVRELVSLMLTGICVVGGLFLYATTGDRANHRAQLDERQRMVLDQALVVAYGVLSAVVLVAVGIVGVLVLVMGKTLTVDATVMTGVASCAAVLIALLPVAALAWVEPERPAED